MIYVERNKRRSHRLGQSPTMAIAVKALSRSGQKLQILGLTVDLDRYKDLKNGQKKLTTALKLSKKRDSGGDDQPETLGPDVAFLIN